MGKGGNRPSFDLVEADRAAIVDNSHHDSGGEKSDEEEDDWEENDELTSTFQDNFCTPCEEDAFSDNEDTENKEDDYLPPPLDGELSFEAAECPCEQPCSTIDAIEEGETEREENSSPCRREDGFTGCSHASQRDRVRVWLETEIEAVLVMCENEMHRGAHVGVEGLPETDGLLRQFVAPCNAPLCLHRIPVADASSSQHRVKAELSRLEKTITWSFGGGDPNAVHNDKVRYALPYEGKSRHVCQGFGGRYSHKGALHYAIDFDMPVGTPVRCSRPGIVCAVRYDSEIGGASSKYKGDANYVNILHADGTEGVYLHMRPNGVAVKPGKKVKKGTLLGYCGLTGYTSRPHVHFHVKMSGDYHEGNAWRSVPITFKAAQGHGGPKGLIPKQGLWYFNSIKDNSHAAKVVNAPWLRAAAKKKAQKN